jgi:hypothetical protein
MTGPVPETETEAVRAATQRPGRHHLVVVTTRPVGAGDSAPAGAMLITRFWHPRDRQWTENAFESLEHAIRLFVDESGWVLRQQQALDGPMVHELIFEARREDFARPSTQQMLKDVGFDADEVAEMLDRVDDGGGGR